MSLLGLRRAVFGAGTALWLCACDGTEFQSDGAGGSAGTGAGKSSGGSANSGGSNSKGGSNSGGSNSSGGSSAGGAPGTGGSVSSGGSGGSVVSSCPVDLPLQGDPCVGDTECSYGECCPTQVKCVGGAWQVYPSACPQPACPSDPPAPGDPCMCLPDSCRYDMCAMGGAVTVAQCRVDGWEIREENCEFDCNGQICGDPQLCLINSSIAPATYSCEPNPCTDDFSCSCLGPMLCPGLECLYADPAARVLNCTCPGCA